MATTGIAPAQTPAEVQSVVLTRFDDSIAYYNKASRYNKRSYKRTRYLLIILGAVVTLISSLSAAKFITGGWVTTFAVLTPVLAASMAIVSGISQAFQWGAAWSDMMITAARLQKERDRIAVTPPDKVEAIKELASLDDLLIAETQSFFQRLFGTGGPSKDGTTKLKP